MKPSNKISCTWTANLAYAIGLIATDGSLSKDGRHLSFISKDLQLIETFKGCLKLKNKIAKKVSGYSKLESAYCVQFGDVNFYKFLLNIGLTPNKSKTMSAIEIPPRYFFDFLRGHFDGDGTFYSYWDKRWRSSFMFYIVFISASLAHLQWLQKYIQSLTGFNGHMSIKTHSRAYQLRYAKKEAEKIIQRLYKKDGSPRLERKYKKIYNALEVDKKNK